MLLFFFAFPVEAHAHAPIKGMGDFLNGLLHPLTTPAHLLIVLGLGLWIGQRTPLNLKSPMLVFAPLSAAALLLTLSGIVKSVHPPFLIAIALTAGALVALDKPLPALWAGALFALAALGLGFDSPVEAGTTASILKTLLGTWISLVVLVCDIAIYISLCTKKPWQKIGVRVVGSWIIAIALLVLAFALKKGGGCAGGRGRKWEREKTGTGREFKRPGRRPFGNPAAIYFRRYGIFVIAAEHNPSSTQMTPAFLKPDSKQTRPQNRSTDASKPKNTFRSCNLMQLSAFLIVK